MNDKPIAIIIPFYNGLETIRQLVQGCIQVLNGLEKEFRIIVIDDSADQGKHIGLQTTLSGIDNVEIFKLSQNFGQHVATFIGLLKTTNEDVITMDEDLQFNPDDIAKLINEGIQSGAEVVYGYVERRGLNGLVRNTAIGAIKPLLANNYSEFTSSFRLLDHSLVEELTRHRPIFIQMEGMIMHKANIFGYVKLNSMDERKEREGGYSLLSLFWMVSGLVDHYSMVPISLVSFILIASNAALLYSNHPLGFGLAPLSILSLLTLVGEYKIRRSWPAIVKEIELQKGA